MRRYFVAGLLVWLPLGVTLLVIKFLVDVMDRSLVLLPEQYRPDALLGMHIPGLGLVLSIVVLFVTGMIVANFFGRRLVSAWEALLVRIPLVRTVYGSVKQVVETVFSSRGKSFRKVLLVEYPRREMWTLAFQTGLATSECHEKSGRDLVSVFIPTTPNPTSGFVILVPSEDLIELDISVDDGLKMIISMGVVTPRQITETAASAGGQSLE